MKTRKGIPWQIEQECPQCGAPITFAETDRLLACPFCRTRLILTANGPLHYYFLPTTTGAGEDLFYLPYRRFRGTFFCVRAGGVDYHLFDATRLARRIQGPPATLGLRPQVMKLRLSTPGAPGRFLAPDLPVTPLLDNGKPMRDVYREVFLGDAVSLVHAPYRLRDGFLYDAIQDRRLCRGPGELLGDWPEPVAMEGTGHFVPALCPHCGWDLEGEKDSLVLICRNCDSAWNVTQKAPVRIPYAVLTSDQTEGKIACCYLPFWRLEPRIEGLSLTSFADLIRLANLPQVITPTFAERPFLIWSPAFKVHPALYIRWARQMTILHPAGERESKLPPLPLYPVTLPLDEAIEGMIIPLAELIMDKRRFYPLLADLRISSQEFCLEYHPFLREGNELIHAHLQVALDATALTYGRQL